MKSGRLITVPCALLAAAFLGLAVMLLGAVAAIACVLAISLAAAVEKALASFRVAVRHATVP